MNQKLSHYRPFHEWPKASQGDFLAGLIEGVTFLRTKYALVLTKKIESLLKILFIL